MIRLFRKASPPRVVLKDGVPLDPDDVLPAHLVRASARARPIDVGRTRLLVTAGFLSLGFMIVSVRLASLMMGTPEDVREPVVADTAAPVGKMRVSRADITDRNGLVLATNLPTVNLYADTRGVPKQELDRAIRELPALFPDLKAATLETELRPGRAFVYLRRNLTPLEQQRVNDLGIPGLNFQRAERRVYPAGRLVTHVVGATDIDNQGIAGIEKSFDTWLASSEEPLTLSLDLRIQHVTRRVLSDAVTHFRAQGASAVVMDVNTGEILAMVSLPDFEPEQIGRAREEERFNRVTLGVYELGSVFKVVNTAMALESGVSLNAQFDASAPIKIGGFTISDYKGKYRTLSIPEIMMYSSNIGSARMAMTVGTGYQQQFLKKIGLLDPIRFELPESGRPLVPAHWRDISTMTVAYGHGLSVTPLHLASAISSIVNGGVILPPTLMKADTSKPSVGTRIISPENSLKMRALMRLVVESGSGKNANIPGYYVGGKTGTADKQVGRSYAKNAVLASFVGVFPMTEPRYIVLVSLDDPQPVEGTYGYRTAGWNAAPTAGRMIAEFAPILGVAPIYETPEGHFAPNLIQTVGLKTGRPTGGLHALR